MNNKFSIFTFVLFFLCVQNTVFAQDKDVADYKSTTKHSLGAAAGFTTGYGLSYRYSPKKFGVKVTFAPYSDDYKSQYSCGVAFEYEVFRTKYNYLYVYQANHYFYRKNKDADNYNQNTYYDDRSVEHFNFGIGFGIEFIILKRIGLDIMGGYAGLENFEKINLTGEIALFYKF